MTSAREHFAAGYCEVTSSQHHQLTQAFEADQNQIHQNTCKLVLAPAQVHPSLSKPKTDDEVMQDDVADAIMSATIRDSGLHKNSGALGSCG